MTANPKPLHERHRCRIERRNGTACVGSDTKPSPKMWQLQFHVNKTAKDSSPFAMSVGCTFSANYFFCFFDNWCYKIIPVPGPRTKVFDVRNLVIPYMKLQFFVELFSCPTIFKIPETCPRSSSSSASPFPLCDSRDDCPTHSNFECPTHSPKF